VKKTPPPAESVRFEDLDRVIHEPARLAILVQLSFVEEADFVYLMRQTGLTKGNLSSHLSKLEEAGYVRVGKGFVGRIPQTVIGLTDRGRKAFESYRERIGALLASRRGD
jgi:DNA-binding MarR family transcriptional regulator